MFRNYLLVAFRNMRRFKGYSFINIFGLAIGICCALLILLWVQDELSYDKFHRNAKNLYRVEQNQFYGGQPYHVNVTPYPSGPVWKEKIPEIQAATRYAWCGGLVFRHGDQAFFENDVYGVDPDFFTMFDYPLRDGERKSVMNDPYAVVINEATATKYFGDENPIGQVLLVDNQYELTVTAVLPRNRFSSVLNPVILINIEFMKVLDRYNDNWGSNNVGTYILLSANADLAEVNRKITEVVYQNREPAETFFMAAPMTGIHLHGYFGFDKEPIGIVYVYVFSIIAGFVLLIACVNFMNLATARSAIRAREIGMRKVVGAFRKSIIFQFIGESILLTFMATLFALLFVVLLLPLFNQIAGKEIDWRALFQWKFLLGALAITILAGIVSGSYPAFFLSGFQPVKVLKGNLQHGRSQILRKVLVVFQFTMSIILIISTLTIYRQLQFMRSKDLGFDEQQVVAISLYGNIGKSYESLRQELVRLPEVLGVTASSHRPTNIGSNSSGVDWDGKDPEMKIVVGLSSVDFDYIETMKIQMLEGRPFSRSFPADPLNDDKGGAFVINERLAKLMNKESVINQRLKFVGVDGTVIGVMKDFHFRSVHNEIEPLALFIAPEWFSTMLVRLQPGDPQSSLEAVKTVWNRLLPNYPFEYRFLDEDFEWMYRNDVRASKLIRSFTVLAVIIACLGLFALASFTAERRTKEIGIRKVLGSSIGNLVVLQSSEFTKWVLIANLIAWPAAWYIMLKWLQNFFYHTNLQVWIFILAGVLTFVTAFITVSYQAIKVAVSNPVKALRYE
jgi:putative ABC transport system permease protein